MNSYEYLDDGERFVAEIAYDEPIARLNGRAPYIEIATL
jgi:hypothetical protein